MSKDRSHKYRHVVESVYGSAWAILPGKLEEILAVLDRRLQGPATAEELAAFPLDDGSDDPEEYTLTPGGVAILSLAGTISQKANLFARMSGGTSTEQFGRSFDKALADSAVRAIVLDVDSPGGKTSGVPELAQKIFDARGKKPIVAVANSLMCSAAYWIGSAADEVVGSPSALVGSIGVYWVHTETSRADAQAGVGRRIISAGKWKTLGNSIEPLTAEGRDKLQAWIDSAYRMFVEAVAVYRNTTTEAVRAGYAEGDAIYARDAKEEGLVDRIATLDQVVADLEQRIKNTASGGAMGAGAAKPSNLKAQGSRGGPRDLCPSNFVPSSQGANCMTAPHLNPRIVAALFAKGLIPEQTDAQAEVALASFFAGRNEPVPSSDAAIMAALWAGPAATSAELASLEISAERLNSEGFIDAAAAKAAERFRAEEAHRRETIGGACELARLGADATREILDLGLSYKESLPKIREKQAAGQGPIPRLDFATGAAEIDKFSAVAQEALDARCMASANPEWASGAVQGLKPEARQFYGMRLRDIGERCLRVWGVRTEGLAPLALAKMVLSSNLGSGVMAMGGPYYTTGSFPQLALNSARKVLMRAYQEAPVSYRMWVRVGEAVQDFKVQSIVKFGEASDLEVTPEGKKAPQDTGISDDREYFAVDKYEKVTGVTLEMFVNDDLSAWSRLPQMQGNAAARTFNKLVYSTLMANPVMADGTAMFVAAASRGNNLLSGVGESPSVATFQKIQAVLRKQHGLNSDSTLNTEMRYCLAPVALEATTKQACYSLADPSNANPEVKNPFAGRITPIIEALLDAGSTTKFWGIADNAQVDTFEIRFLSGEESPVLEDWWDFETDQRMYKVRQSGAVVPVDFRGMVQDNGT